MKKIRTKGNVIINEIEIGDTHYEYEYGICIKSTVISKPIRNDDGYWHWESRRESDGKIIQYGQAEGYAHYGIKLYDYEAYMGCKMV